MIKFTKKLSLNKETIAHLRSIDMKKVAGGVGTIFPYCIETYPPLCEETEWTCYTGPPMHCMKP